MWHVWWQEERERECVVFSSAARACAGENGMSRCACCEVFVMLLFFISHDRRRGGGVTAFIYALPFLWCAGQGQGRAVRDGMGWEVMFHWVEGGKEKKGKGGNERDVVAAGGERVEFAMG